MPRSEEAKVWFSSIYAIVQQIPYGKVTSYRHIAFLLNEAKTPNRVSNCLRHLPGAISGETFHKRNVPWQRVVTAKGMISHHGSGPGSAARQAERLSKERITVDHHMGKYYVDMGVFG
ncbi:6-O-methylguanine DNA methyltransferase [Aspergillus filifer]